LIRCPNHENVKNGEWENECVRDQIGTSKNSYIVLRTKDEFGRKIVRNKGSDTKKSKKAIRTILKVESM
jgi:hypothetical protein